jgi:hypothetical protein
VCGMSSNHEGVFIGWGMEFEFFRKNYDTPPSYMPAAPVAGGTTVGTDSIDSNGGGTAHPRRPIPVQASGHASSAPMAVIDRATASNYPGSVSTHCRWNHPYKYNSL